MVENLPLLAGRARKGRHFLPVFTASVVVVCLLLVNSSFDRPQASQQLVSIQNGESLFNQQKTKYYYVQSSLIHPQASIVPQNPINKWKAPSKQAASIHSSQLLLDPDVLGLKPFANGTAPAGASRSCAISSLIEQANLVFAGWDQCGYILNAGPNLQLIVGNGHPDAAISGPPNSTGCTTGKMDKEPCRTEFVRTLARNDPSSLQNCVGRVRGLSQTCRTYSRCGPRPSNDVTSWFSLSGSGEARGICGGAGAVDYFLEPEVERMCGVCDMYRAIMPDNYVSPTAAFANDKVKASASGLQARPVAAALAAALGLAAAAGLVA